MPIAFVRSAAIVHADVEFTGNVFTGKYYVSLVNFKSRQVCLDIPLRVPDDPMPRLTMVSDTLYAIVQHADDSTASGTFMVRMHVDAKICPWNYVGTRR